MSVILYVEEGGERRNVWRLSETRSKIFLGIANTAASVFRVKTGIYPDSPVWRIEPGEFCALVEKVFASPSELLYPWAQQAAGIYEAIKGETYSWEWNRNSYPIEIFPVERYEEYTPKARAKRTIGSFY